MEKKGFLSFLHLVFLSRLRRCWDEYPRSSNPLRNTNSISRNIMEPQSVKLKRKSASGVLASPDVAGTDENNRNRRAKSADGPVIPGPGVVDLDDVVSVPKTVDVYSASGDPLTISIVDSMLTADGQAVKVIELMKHIAQERKTSRWGVVLYDTETPEPDGSEANDGGGGGEDLPFFQITATIPLADLCGELPKRDLGFYIVPIGVSPHFSGEAVTRGKLCIEGRISVTEYIYSAQYSAGFGTNTSVGQFLRHETNSAKPTLLDLAYIGDVFRGEDITATRKNCAAINDLAVRQSRGYTLHSLALNTGLFVNNPYFALDMPSEYAAALCRDWGAPGCTLEKLHVHGPLPLPLLQKLAENCPPELQELEISWLTSLGGLGANPPWARPGVPTPDHATHFLGFVKAFGKLITALPSRSIRKIVLLSLDDDGDIDPTYVFPEVDAYTAEQVPASALEEFANAFGHLEHLEVLHLGNILGHRLRQAVAQRAAADADYLPALQTSCSVQIAGARAGVELEKGPQWCHIEVVPRYSGSVGGTT